VQRKPLLKQFGALTPNDFAEHPVWAQCHVIDYDEPWYDSTDEETFRPWDGPLPVDPQNGTFLVRSTFKFADGTRQGGFLTPQHLGEPLNLGLVQPHLFAPSGKLCSFWWGMTKPTPGDGKAFYAALGKQAKNVFPLDFEAEAALASGQTSGVIRGFYFLQQGSVISFVP
jgi:hypothetical protein